MIRQCRLFVSILGEASIDTQPLARGHPFLDRVVNWFLHFEVGRFDVENPVSPSSFNNIYNADACEHDHDLGRAKMSGNDVVHDLKEVDIRLKSKKSSLRKCDIGRHVMLPRPALKGQYSFIVRMRGSRGTPIEHINSLESQAREECKSLRTWSHEMSYRWQKR